MPPLALVLAATLAVDGGVGTLYTACPDAPMATQVDGGWFMPEARWNRTNCRLAACETWVNGSMELGTAELSAPLWLAITLSVVATLATGIYIGVKAEQALRP